MFGRRNGVDEELLEAKSPGAARRPAEAPKTTSPKASSSNAGSSNGAAATENVGAGPRPVISPTAAATLPMGPTNTNTITSKNSCLTL